MKDYTTEASKFLEAEIPPETKKFVAMSMDISEQVIDYLKEEGLTQRDFAKALDKSEAEISKWLSGVHNLTLKSIAKMAAALDKDLITTPRNAKEAYTKIKYVTLKVHDSFRGYSNPKFAFDDFRKSGEFEQLRVAS